MKITKIIIVIMLATAMKSLIAYNNSLEVITDIPGVSVYLGDQYLGQTNGFDTINILTTDSISPGHHRLICKHEGYSDIIRDIILPNEGTKKIVVDYILKEVKAISLTDEGRWEPIRNTGTVIVRSKPTGADIFLNGVRSNKRTDALIPAFPVGHITLRCTYGQNRLLETDFYLTAEDTVRVIADFLEDRIDVFVRYKATFSSKPEGIISIDGKIIGEGPQSVRLERGSYEVQIERRGFNTLTTRVDVVNQELFSYEMELNSAPVEINSTPVSGAGVFLNDKLVGTTPYKDDFLDAGDYTLRIEKEQYLNVYDSITVTTGEPLALSYNLEKNIGILKVTAAESEIRLNNEVIGIDSVSTELVPGRYNVTAARDKHHNHSQDVTIYFNRTTELNLNPRPVEGTVTVIARNMISKDKAHIDNLSLLFNKERTPYKTSMPITMLIGTYEIGIDSDDYIVRHKPQTVELTQGLNSDYFLQVESVQTIRDRANFWGMNKWIAFAGAALAVGGAVYYDIEGQKHLDDYDAASGPIFRLEAWENAEKSFDNRDVCVYVSITPLAYALFSWYRQASYNGRLRR